MARRYRIGLVVAAIEDDFSSGLARGAMRMAEKLDANLVIFPGNYIGADQVSEDSSYNYQYNSLFSCAAAANLDYVIVATGTIGYQVDDNRKKNLLKLFGKTPLLNVASKIEGYDYLIFDNATGIRAAMEHLIVNQGYKHIGMIRGSDNNFEATERFNAYRESIDKFGLEYHDRYSMEGGMFKYIEPVLPDYLDINPELDAIMCVNDQVASAVYNVLEKRQIEIGKQIAVVGFDNQQFTNKMEPSLTSIKADVFKMGEVAVEKAVNYLNGIVDNRHFIDTELVLRASAFRNFDETNNLNSIFDGNISEIGAKISNQIFANDTYSEEKNNLCKDIDELLALIISRFADREGSNDDCKDIENYITKRFFRTGLVDEFFENMQKCVDSGYRYLINKIAPVNKEYLQRIYNFFYHRLTFMLAVSSRDLREKNLTKNHYNNIFLRDTMMINGNINDSCSMMIKRLHMIGSDTAFIYLLEQPIEYYEGETFPMDVTWDFVSYVYGKDVFNVPEYERKMKTPMLFANSHVNCTRRCTLVAIDLFCKEKQYGVLLCEPREFSFFDEVEFLTSQISSAINTMYILKDKERILGELHSKNLSLDNISKIDELTNMFNRRGFYAEAEKMIQDNLGITNRYIIGYADMDNLKYVNDHFGHAEGDFAIKALADALKEIAGDKAIVGRMGGDEYALIVPAKDSEPIDELRKKKKVIISELNERAKKPFDINMSLGLIECVCENSYDLKEDIDRADGMLYREKSNRVKKQ